MPLPDFRPLNPHGQIRAAELDRLGRELVAQDHLTGGGPEMTVGRSAGGFQVGVNLPLNFWARITGSGSGTPTPHAWTQQLENDDGTFDDDGEGRTGTLTSYPAYAVDGSEVPDDTIVRLYLGQGGEFFLFQVGGDACMGLTTDVVVVTNVTCVDDVLTVTFKTLSFECGKLVAVTS